MCENRVSFRVTTLKIVLVTRIVRDTAAAKPKRTHAEIWGA